MMSLTTRLTPLTPLMMRRLFTAARTVYPNQRTFEMRTVLDRLAEDFDGSGDHGENVVEVVGDATGELTDRFHLLRLPDLGLGGLDLLKTLDHGLGAAAQPDFLLERRIGPAEVECESTSPGSAATAAAFPR
jgi:hypothetical protein